MYLSPKNRLIYVILIILIKLLCMMDFIILAKKNSINNLLKKKQKVIYDYFILLVTFCLEHRKKNQNNNVKGIAIACLPYGNSMVDLLSSLVIFIRLLVYKITQYTKLVVITTHYLL